MNPVSAYFWEIVGENGDILTEEGDEGRVLISTLHSTPLSLPFLRYDTGDRAKIIHTEENHNKCEYELLGRSEIDTIRLVGGLLKADEVERVLSSINPLWSSTYQLHFYKDKKPRAEIHIPDLDIERANEIALNISKVLRVSPTFTYGEGVVQGLYEPLTCKPSETKLDKNKKRTRFVRHDI